MGNNASKKNKKSSTTSLLQQPKDNTANNNNNGGQFDPLTHVNFEYSTPQDLPSDSVLSRVIQAIKRRFSSKEEFAKFFVLEVCYPIAMVSQFGSGGLTGIEIAEALDVDSIDNKIAEDAVLAVSFLLLAYGSYIGKKKLVTFFGANNYILLSDPKKFFKEKFTKWDMLNWLTLVPAVFITPVFAGVFGGLTPLAFMDMSHRTKNDFSKNAVTTALTKIFANPYVSIPFAAASLATNLLSGPYIIKGGVENVVDFFTYIAENPSFRAKSERVALELEYCRIKSKVFAENGLVSKAEEFLSKVLEENISLTNLTETKVNEIIQRLATMRENGALAPRLIKISKEYSQQSTIGKPQPQGWMEFADKNFKALILAVIAAYGLNNFIGITRMLCAMIGIDADSRLATVLACLDYIGMIALAFSVYKPTVKKVGQDSYDRESDLDLLPAGKRSEISSKAFGWAALGAAPNAWQILHVMRENGVSWSPWRIAFELAAGVVGVTGVEYYPFRDIETNAAIKKELEIDPSKDSPDTQYGKLLKKLAYGVNDQLIGVKTDVANNANTVNQLEHQIQGKAAEVPVENTPRYWGTTVKNYVTSLFFKSVEDVEKGGEKSSLLSNVSNGKTASKQGSINSKEGFAGGTLDYGTANNRLTGPGLL